MVVPMLQNQMDQSTIDNLKCRLTIDVDKDIPGPVFVYYELDGYYQNHRR